VQVLVMTVLMLSSVERIDPVPTAAVQTATYPAFVRTEVKLPSHLVQAEEDDNLSHRKNPRRNHRKNRPEIHQKKECNILYQINPTGEETEGPVRL